MLGKEKPQLPRETTRATSQRGHEMQAHHLRPPLERVMKTIFRASLYITTTKYHPLALLRATW